MIKDTSFTQFLGEGFRGHYEVPGNSVERATRLKFLIDQGDCPDVWTTGFTMGKFSFGDLEKAGYAERRYDAYGRGVALEWWEYTGPNVMCAVTTYVVFEPGHPKHSEIRKYMRKGDTTEKIEVDYGALYSDH